MQVFLGVKGNWYYSCYSGSQKTPPITDQNCFLLLLLSFWRNKSYPTSIFWRNKKRKQLYFEWTMCIYLPLLISIKDVLYLRKTFCRNTGPEISWVSYYVVYHLQMYHSWNVSSFAFVMNHSGSKPMFNEAYLCKACSYSISWITISCDNTESHKIYF